MTFKKIDIKCPYIPPEEIRLKADNFRKKFWPQNQLPVNIEKIIEHGLDLYIEPKINLRREHDIDAYLKLDDSGIVVDQDLYMDDRQINRLRFSFAHEIGHHVLHRNISVLEKISSIESWYKFYQMIPDREYSFFEYQAHEFAGRLLVPVEELERCLQNQAKIVSENDDLLRMFDLNPQQLLDGIVRPVSSFFGVSDMVIQKRLDREKLWPDRMKYYLVNIST